jgi:hypothetical protein
MSEADDIITRLQRSVESAQRAIDATSRDVHRPMRADTSTQAEATLQWVVRFAWDVVRGLPHPKYTYTNKATETEAFDHAVQTLDNYDNGGSVRLVEVHVKGPGRDWVKVD